MAATSTAVGTAPPGGRLLPLVAVVLLAFNLRPVVNAAGAVVPELRDDTGLSAGATGVLLSLPLLAFALLGLAAPGLAARFGPHRTVVGALVALVAGQVLRAAGPPPWALFAGSVVALAGIAVTNVALPGLVRLHFPDRIPALTAAYTTLLTAGGAVAAAGSVPAGDVLGGGWRTGLGIWAATAAVALAPWVVLVVRTRTGSATVAGQRLPLRLLARTRLAWTLALYFGIQAMIAYVTFGWLPEILTHRGFSEAAAGVQAAIVILVGIPPAMVVPGLLARSSRAGAAILAVSFGYVGGYLGLVVVPDSLVVLCSVLIGIGTAAFPIALALITLRARAALATTSLSAFVQCAGYLLATAGPIGFGAFYERVGSWTPPLVALAGLALLQGLAGMVAVRGGRVIEDELPAGAV